MYAKDRGESEISIRHMRKNDLIDFDKGPMFCSLTASEQNM